MNCTYAGFVKKYRSSESKSLKREHPSAYLVLDTVAENAKIQEGVGHPLLEMGEAIITSEECGISPQQFETALKYLSSNRYIEILHRGRRDKNSILYARNKPETLQMKLLNTSRINGTVVKLLDSTIWDINLNNAPKHIPKQTRNTSDETPNKQERKEIRNKEEYNNDEAVEPPSEEKIHPLTFDEEEAHQSSKMLPLHASVTLLGSLSSEESSPVNIICNIGNEQNETKSQKEEINQNKPIDFKSNLNKISFSFQSKCFENIPDDDYQAWKELYPAANHEFEFKRMIQWILDNSSKAKSKKKWRTFICNWLSKANESALNKQAFQQGKGTNSGNRAILGGKHVTEYDNLW